MIITLDKKLLIEPLKAVTGVSEQKHSMAVLGNVLIKISGGELLMVCSDLEVEVSARINCDVEESIETTMPSKKLLEIVKALNDEEEIKFNIEDTKTTITSAKSKFILATIPAKEFPYVEQKTEEKQTIDINALDQVISETSFSMAFSDARHFLNGLFFEINDEKITVVATDGHRLAMSATPNTDKKGTTKTCIIPRKCINELKRILGSFKDNKQMLAEVSINSKEIMFNVGCFVVKSKLIEGNYPDYNKVFPDSLPNKLSVDKETLRAALQRMSILSNDQFKGVKLLIKKTELKLSTNNPSQEEGEDIIECNYGGDEIEVGFNLNYLLEVIDVVGSKELCLELKNPDSGCLISSGSKTSSNKYIIMPMRV
jgi:DNA polymerase III subunit beta